MYRKEAFSTTKKYPQIVLGGKGYRGGAKVLAEVSTKQIYNNTDIKEKVRRPRRYVYIYTIKQANK